MCVVGDLKMRNETAGLDYERWEIEKRNVRANADRENFIDKFSI